MNGRCKPRPHVCLWSRGRRRNTCSLWKQVKGGQTGVGGWEESWVRRKQSSGCTVECPRPQSYARKFTYSTNSVIFFMLQRQDLVMKQQPGRFCKVRLLSGVLRSGQELFKWKERAERQSGKGWYCVRVWRRERERLSQETAYNLAWGALVCVWNRSCEMRSESRNQMEMESN